jgi:hypothetical protein
MDLHEPGVQPVALGKDPAQVLADLLDFLRES